VRFHASRVLSAANNTLGSFTFDILFRDTHRIKTPCFLQYSESGLKDVDGLKDDEKRFYP